MEQPIGNSENITPNTQNTVNETRKEDSNLAKIEPIEGSPFVLVTRNGKSFVAMGDYRITEEYNTADEALDTFVTEPWMITVRLITIVVDKYDKMRNEFRDQIKPIITEDGARWDTAQDNHDPLMDE